MKVKVYLIQIPRWFALPFFSASLLLGAVIAGGITANAWIAFAAGALLMASGHAWNSVFDYMVGLDKGEADVRSAEKDYTGGQSLIAKGVCSLREVAIVASVYNLIALGLAGVLAAKIGWPILLLAILGSLVAPFYTWSKFHWTHELALGIGVGPIAVFLGMYSVNPSPPIAQGLLVSIPFVIALSFLGLALDEFPDWKQNVDKGVKSIAYKVSELGISLEWYCSTWLLFMLIYHVFLVQIGMLKPLTGLAFIPAAIIIPFFVLLKANFRKTMMSIVLLGALYVILLLVGQVFGG